MVGHGGSSAGSYLADPTSPIPSHCASIVATSTVRGNFVQDVCLYVESRAIFVLLAHTDGLLCFGKFSVLSFLPLCSAKTNSKKQRQNHLKFLL